MMTVNNRIAVTPFETTSTKIDVKGGLVTIKQRTELTRLVVVFAQDNEKYPPGYVIWVKGDSCKHQFAKEVFNLNGKDFILIPAETVVLAEPPTQ